MIREFAKRLQFINGTTIDGNRLDSFMQALIDRFNRLLPRDIERVWTETTFVTGYQPVIHSATYPTPVMPWLPLLNDVFGAPDAPPYYPTNKWRVRGTEVDGIVPGTSGSQRCWTNSFMATRPSIMTGVSLTLRTDTSTTFKNDFQYGALAPPGFSNGDSVEDFQIEVAIDNPFSLENRAQSNCEVQRIKFPASSWQMTTGAAVVDVMQPPYPDGVEYPAGLFINLDVRVPIPQNSRVRVRLVIPQYESGVYDAGWGEDSYIAQFYSATFSILEKG